LPPDVHTRLPYLTVCPRLWYDEEYMEGHLRRYRTHCVILLLYLMLALALTWPLVTQITTHIPGSPVWAFDEFTFVWNMWWFKFSLLDLHQSPLYSDYIFYPLGIDLVLYTFNFFNAALGLPLQLVFPLPLASNLVILAAYVLSGYGSYLLLRYLLVSQRDVPVDSWPLAGAAFVAGAAYAFAASRMIYAALGHYDMVTAQCFPFYALFFLKTLREPSYKNAVLAGLFAAFALFAEMIFGVFLLFLSLILIVGELAASRHAPETHATATKHDRRQTSSGGQVSTRVRRAIRLYAALARLLVLVLTAGVVWSPVMLPVLDAFAHGDFALQGWGDGLKLSADLVGWFTPTALHPLFGASDWPAYLRAVVEGHAPTNDVNTVFLGYGVLALALLGCIFAWRQVCTWAWGAFLFAILTLGPLLQINGRYLFSLDNLLREQGLAQDVTVPLPFALLHYIPIVRANRVPNRFSVVLVLALAVLVGYGAALLLRRAARWSRQVVTIGTILLLLVVLFDQISVPMPLSDAHIPEAYQEIAAQEDDFAILELPLGWRNSFGTVGAEETRLQYYQTHHHKRLLAGNISRAPAFKFDYFKRIPLFYAITETEMYRTPDETTLARARKQAGDLLTLYDLRYLIVHDAIPLRYPYVDTLHATRELVLALLPHVPTPLASADGVLVYRLLQPPLPNLLRIDLGDWRSAPYRGEGWGEDEEVFGATANWVIGTQAQLFFPVRGKGERRIALRIAPFDYPDAAQQALTLTLNGQSLRGRITLDGGWQITSVRLPESMLRQGLNTLTLHFAHAVPPATVLDVSDSRPLAAAVDWMEVASGR